VTDATDLSFQVFALLTDGSMPAPGTPGTAVSIEDGAYQLTVNPAFGGIYQISVQLGAAEIGEGRVLHGSAWMQRLCCKRLVAALATTT